MMMSLSAPLVVPLLACTAFVAPLGAFMALGMAMNRHWEDAFGRGTDPGRWRRWMQFAGITTLLLSLASCLLLQGTTIGWVLWFGALTAAALVTVAVLTFAPPLALRIGAVASVLAWASAVATAAVSTSAVPIG